MDAMALQSFLQFTELPEDIRRIIWQYGLAIPRIVEYKPNPDDLFVSLNLFRFGIHYRPIPHPLSITCRESREETLRTYGLEKPRNEAIGVFSNFWTRFDYDIVHFKDLYFAADCSGYAPSANWAFSPWRIYYKGRPTGFENIENVAMPWEFWRTERFDALISNFFPKLKVLIFLIDDSKPNAPRHEATSLTDITRLYKEPSVRHLLPAFVREATGPFTEVVLNKDFESEVLDLAKRYLEIDGVRILVRGCVLPHTKVQTTKSFGERFTKKSVTEDAVRGKRKSAGFTSCCCSMWHRVRSVIVRKEKQ